MRAHLLAYIAVTSVMGAVASAASFSEDFSRARQWEVYGFGQGITIFNVMESDAGIFGGGLGVGYNISQHFNVTGDFSISSVDLHESGLFNWSDNRQSMLLYLGNFSLDYNILKSPVTPVISVQAGVGAFSEGSGALFDQNIGAGIRWDATDHLFLKAMLRGGAWETTSEEHKGWVSIGLTVALGYKL